MCSSGPEERTADACLNVRCQQIRAREYEHAMPRALTTAMRGKKEMEIHFKTFTVRAVCLWCN